MMEVKRKQKKLSWWEILFYCLRQSLGLVLLKK